ncbi:GDNF-inducible zinc finger protein 1-like [Saccostrea cucullata]|uniref:GDNF-inducible zinc finger protein 1-like n=1 Tax=Saccostrea cuccullata TaxID=36930 RepID=UPI002ED23C29
MVESEDILIPYLTSRLSETLFLFQQKRYLCDVMIITANGFIPAHRVVLVAASKYFYEAETTRHTFDSSDPNFHLNYDIEDVRKVVNMLYTGKMTVTKFNVDRVAAICAELKLNDALEKCIVFMAEVGVANHVMLGLVDVPERNKDVADKSDSNVINADIANHEGQGVNILNCETDSGKPLKEKSLKRKYSITESENNDQKRAHKKPKLPAVKKAKTNKMTTPSHNVSDKESHATSSSESMITIEPHPVMASEENISSQESLEVRRGQSPEQDETAENSLPESNTELTKVEKFSTDTDDTATTSQLCMFMDLNELKVYHSKPAHAEKITKQFDPDGSITEAVERDQEFLTVGQVEKRVNCRKCKMVFKDVESLAEHRREIHPSNCKKERFVCDICNAKPNNHVTLVEHKFKKHGIAYDKTKYPIYKCEEQDCEFQTIVPYKLSEHKTTVHSGLACICETCGRAFKSKSVLRYHIQSNHSGTRPKFICNTCGKTYFTAQALKKHMEYHTGTQKRLLCHLCPYSSVGKQELNNHLLKLHNVPVPRKTKVYQCEKCDYYSLNRTQFNRHVAMHDGGENAFKCSECDKTFPSMYNLKSHEKRHKAETVNCPYEGCNFFTKFKHILKNHITGKHTNTNFKPYKCHLCDHSCKLKGNLNKHLVNKHGLEVMTEVKQRKIALETGQGYNEILVDRAKSRIACTIPAMFPEEGQDCFSKGSERRSFCSNIYAFHREFFRSDRSMSGRQNETSGNEDDDFTSTTRSLGESRMNMTIGQQAENQAKFCQARVANAEKYLGSLCEVMGSITRKTARIRDKGDILAKICKDYSDEETVSHSLKAGLRFCAENLSVIQDYRHAQVQRLESKVVRPLSDYGNICKQIKAGVKRELDAVKREDKKKTDLQKLRSKNPANTHQIAQSDVERARENASIGSKHLEEQMVTFEKRRLHDIKSSMLDYFKVQLVFHAKAIEFYSKCFESMSLIDEERDLQEFQRKLSMARGAPDSEDISHALTSMTTTNGHSDTLGSTDPYTSTYESTASDQRRVRISQTSTMYGDDDDEDDDDDYYDDDEYDLSTAR